MIARLQRIPSRAIGVGFVVAFTAVTLIAFSGLFKAPFKPDTRQVVAVFDSASQLYKGDDVRLEGNVEGIVTKVEATPDGNFARVTMDVEKDAGDIYADAKARTRIKTLLAGSYYVAIERGTKNAGPLGDRSIQRENTHVQVEVDDVLDVFREGALTGFKTLPGETSEALTNPLPLAVSIQTANEIARDATQTLDAVRGQDEGTDLPRLVQATARTVAALDSRDDDVRRLVSGAAATLQTTGRREQEIRDVIDAAPSVTFDMTRTLARLDGTLDVADGLIDRLRPSAPRLDPTLTALRPALGSTDDLLDTARPLLRQAIPLLTNLGDISSTGVPLVNRIKPAIRKFDETIIPYLAREDPETGKSTSVMIGGTAAGFGGAAAQKDENGHFIRFPATIGTSSAYVPCRSSLIEPDEPSLLACDSFDTAVNEYLGYLPELGGNAVPPMARKQR